MGLSNSTIASTTAAAEAKEESYTEAIKYVKEHGVADVETFGIEQIEAWKKVRLTFAIAGDSGAGKSAFINAVRGLKDYEDGAAKVNVKEQTKEPTQYRHPNNPNIEFWDLPGIGTPRYPNIEEYCMEVDLQKFDAFLIFLRGRLTNHDLGLAEVAKSFKKPFFVIRTHADNECENAKKSQGPKFDEKETLKTMRQDCFDSLGNLLANERDIYLIDNYVKEKWEFDRLIDAISNVLPKRIKESFILSLSNVTSDCLRKKARILKVRALTVVAATTAVVVSSSSSLFQGNRAIALEVILHEINEYRTQFGLPENDEGLDTDVERRVLQYYFPSVVALFDSLSAELVRYAGTIISSSYIIADQKAIISSAFTCSCMAVYLVRCIDEMEERALRIWDMAAEVMHAIPHH